MAAGNYRCILSLLTLSAGLCRRATNGPQRILPRTETSATTRSCISEPQLKVRSQARPGFRTLLKPLFALSVLHTLDLFQEDSFVGFTPLHLHCKLVISISSCIICLQRSGCFFHCTWGCLPPRGGKGNVGTIAVSPLKLRWTRNSSRYCHVTV